MYKCIYVYTVCPLLLYSQLLSFFKNSFTTANLVFEIFMASMSCSLKCIIKIGNVKKLQYKCCYGGCMLPFGFCVKVIDIDCKFSCKKILYR